jgi:hypothetical protein
MKRGRQNGQREQWSSAPAWLAGRGEPAWHSEEAQDIVAVSLKDGQRAADLSGHGLHAVASAAEASVWRISTPRRSPRMKVRANIRGILHLLILE